MIREIVTIKDYERIAKENEYFLWHFVQKEQQKNSPTIFSYFVEDTSVYKKQNDLKPILDKVNIPYFESYTEESVDFLIDLGLPGSLLYTPPPPPPETSKNNRTYIPREFYHSPVILGFNRFLYKSSTFETCYCIEGVIDLISKLNIDFLINSELD
jgi:hypothetical protein